MAGPDASHAARPPCPRCGYLAETAAGKVNFCPRCGQDLQSGSAGQESAAALLGLIVAERYKLIGHLGVGGMGSVYKAEHVRMGKALAVKLLRGDFARDPAAVERFRAEARIVSRLSHPNTIAVFDFGEVEALGGFYLAMEYVPGRDLSRVLREQGRLPEARAADLGQQILGSLAEAHEVGIVHRDVKPGNVMLMETRPGEDFAKVLDFGIAKLRDDVSSGQTSAGSIVGTPNYLAPEQARGEPLDARADLYAVGCLLHELLTGEPPFAGRGPVAVVNAHLHEPPPPLGPEVSGRFAAIVHRALAKRPDDRFASADEMRQAILDLGEPTSTRSLATGPQLTGELEIASRQDFAAFERQVEALRRRRRLAPISLVVLALAAGALAWRWELAYGALARHAPALAALIPERLRPADRFDGAEHEPNDLPSQANRLPLPAVSGAGVAIRGTVGATADPSTGDADVYRLELPASGRTRVLSASWHAEGSADGIAGLDVVLTLHRSPAEGTGGGAPLVASADRGGPGAAERLQARVEPGTYFLSVKERHREGAGAVSRPDRPYLLEVRLDEARPGEEVEPNDSPESAGQRAEGYRSWLAVAEQNVLAAARPLQGELSPGDVDTLAVAPGTGAAVLVVLPGHGLAAGVEAWSPGPEELAAVGDRAGFGPAGRGGPGEPVVALVQPGAEGAAVLVQLRAVEGRGRYSAVALGSEEGDAERTLELVRSLADGGQLPSALEVAAAVARQLPGAPVRAEAFILAGRLAQEAAPRLGAADRPRFERASRLLGVPVFAEEGGRLWYRGAFERRVEGRGPLAEEAGLTALRLARPCTPALVAERAEAFAARFPGSRHLPEVRRWRARALELELAASGHRDPTLSRAAMAAWERALRGADAAEARAALARLRGKKAHPSDALPAVCPDPGG